jgi:hypothetical protein
MTMTNANSNTSTTTGTTRGTTTGTTLYAQPYSLAHVGFYFTSLEEFEAGMDKLRKQGAEEVELDYTDGDDYALFNAAGVNQGNIGEWFKLRDELEDYQLPALFYLLDNMGDTMAEALEHLDDVSVFEGNAQDYVHEYIEDTGMLDALPEQLRYYFDYEAFARDMVLNGDVTECEYDGTTYVMGGV